MTKILNVRPDPEVEPNLPPYLADLSRDNMSPRTIRDKRLTILRLARRFGHPLADATPAELTAWQLAQLTDIPPGRDGPKQQSSLRVEITHVTGYFRWLVQTERRDDDPTIKGLRQPRRTAGRGPKPIPEADLRRAVLAASDPLRLWLELGAFAGLRCMEIAAVQAEDVLDSPPRLRVFGKGRKERHVTISAALHERLTDPKWPATGHLFTRLDGHGGPPSAMRVSEQINDYLHSLGIRSTAHCLRHRFGTKLYAATNDPFVVADQMAHSSTDTTRMYVQLAQDRARSAIEAISALTA